MTKREIIHTVLAGQVPPYVPWSCGFTQEARAKLEEHFKPLEIEDALQNHLLKLGSDIGFFTDLGNNHVQDVFGVVWDRSIDKDIGNVVGCILPEPTLEHYTFPDPLDQRFFAEIPERIAQYGDRFRVFQIGFSLYERAWTLRGMQNLLMDFYDHPDFVHSIIEFDRGLQHCSNPGSVEVRRSMRFILEMIGGNSMACKWDRSYGTNLFIRCSSACIRPCMQAGKICFHPFLWRCG